MAESANEEKPLLGSQSPSTYTFGDESATTSNTDTEDGPWPATYERSIALLAGPVTNVDDIDRITRSPRFVPIQAINARKKLQKLGRGYLTPDPTRKGIAASPDAPSFAPMKKTQSLDYRQSSNSAKLSISADREAEKKLKLAEASIYRQKILAGATNTRDDHGRDTENADLEMNSPGYQREKATDKQKMKQQEIQKSNVGTATFWQTVFNMANILMGVGMLGLPYLFMKAGWIGGFFVCSVFSGCVWRTSIIMGRELNGDHRPTDFFDDYLNMAAPGSSPSARMTKPFSSFPEMARNNFGTASTIMLSIVLYFELFSCLCIYFVSLGDHLNALFPSITRERLTLYTAALITGPAIFLRTPRLLSYLSLIGTVSTIFIVFAVVASAVVEGDISDQVAESKGILLDGSDYILWDTSGLPLALGMIGFCFSGHAIVPSLAKSMEHPQDYEKMIHVTFVIVITCCFSVAASGYYMFGPMVDDQITISLELSSNNPGWAMTMLTWLMILTQFSKFALTLFPLSLGMEEIFAPFIHSEGGMATTSAIVKLVYIVLAFEVAFHVPSFSFICALVGLICTMIVSVIFPAAVHIKMFGQKLTFIDKCFDWFLVIGGILSAIIGTIATLK